MDPSRCLAPQTSPPPKKNHQTIHPMISQDPVVDPVVVSRPHQRRRPTESRSGDWHQGGKLSEVLRPSLQQPQGFLLSASIAQFTHTGSSTHFFLTKTDTFLFNKDGRLLCGPSMGMKDIKWKSPFLSRKQQVSKEKEQTTEEHTSSSKPTVQVDTHRVDRSEIDPRWANGHPPGGPGHLPVPEGVDEGRGWRVGRWKVNGEGNLCISSEVEEVLCLRLIS